MGSRNPWLDDDDGKTSAATFDPNFDYLQEHKQAQQSTMQSQQRALRVLAETEEVGADTAVELKRQGEVLNRAERKVDKIEENLKVADYHMKTVKSWWGGFVNKMRKKPPVTKTSDDEVLDDGECMTKKVAEASSEVVNTMNLQNQVNQVRGQPTNSRTNQLNSRSTTYDVYEHQIESNLDQMSSGLNRLKNMGLDLQTELDNQNQQLNRLGQKTERVDTKTAVLNQELRRLNK